ncbi:MAG: T9SS type A sorting domain-containing protein [Bacteroidales bacterium]|nr:T9SS type A sorting domain-containing protein [Bacteroidales bacterium]
MKKTLTISLLSAILYLLSGWNGIKAQEPLDFSAYYLNPVLTPGGPGSYDDAFLTMPNVLWNDGMFYLFYSGNLDNGGICLATSPDGYNFEKFPGNPVFTRSEIGFDSYYVTQGIVLEMGSQWVMYYNGRDVPGYGPGQFVGQATSSSLTGIWERMADPVLTSGSPGEWDEGFITPNAVLPLDTGGYIMFYSASTDFFTGFREIGMATSQDGITWTKYNDPNTSLPPYAESDPVLNEGTTGQWDEYAAWLCSVIHIHGYYEMYYSGYSPASDWNIGYAWSNDGITWEKWPENPVYTIQDDPYAFNTSSIVETPSILVYNETVLMYYDYGTVVNSIGVATADVWTGAGESTNSDFRMTIYPNPVDQSTTFSYTLEEPGHVTIQIFNSFGRLVDEPVTNFQPTGKWQVFWNAEAYPAGIYFYRIQAGNEVGSGKIIKW